MVWVKERETKMKGIKEEDKHFDPLFPRINISEAERGGPRAPPRNKMALCEQLTLPSSHEFNSGSMSMLPLPPPSTSSNFTSSSPPSHVDFHKMGMFSLFSSGNGHDLGGRHPHSSNGVTNSTLMAPDFRSLMPLSYQSTVQWLPTSEHSMLQPHCFVNPRNITAEKYRGQVNNVRLSSFTRLGRSAVNGNTLDPMEKHDHPFSCSSSTGKLQTSAEKKLNRTSLGEFKIVKEEGSCHLSPISENRVEKSTSAQPSNENMCRDTNVVLSRVLVRDKSVKLDNSALRLEYTPKNVEANSHVSKTHENHFTRPGYILSTRPKTLPDATSDLLPGDRNVEPNANADPSIGQKSNILSDDENRFDKASIHVHHNFKRMQENKESKDCVPTSSAVLFRKRSASVMEGLSRSMDKVGYINNVSNRRKSTDELHKDKDCGSEAGGISDKSDSMSDETVGKSIANFIVTPKEVIRAIGQERFWNARKTILDQQRILAAQLFDLHRLVKVQRLIAESPEMIFEDNFYLRKPSIKLQHPRKLFAETNEDVKANLQESNFKIEHMPEIANRKPPPLNTDNGIYPRQPPPIPCPRELVVPPITNDTKSSSLLFHPPPGNQWLVPVRSPSEGLIYKPYTGPLPPTAGILSPFYDNAAPISLTGVGDQSFLNTTYNLPASNIQSLGNLLGHSALGQSYLQPYPIPSLNASGSTSTFEPTSKFIKHPIPDQDISTPISSIQPHKNGIVSECSKLVDGRKENDLQDNTETNPLVRNKVDILSLFPTTPSHHPHLSSSASEQKIQAIKVVPHNRKSGSESAARIFQTIQEERKKHG